MNSTSICTALVYTHLQPAKRSLIVAMPFCSAVPISSGEYYTLYSALKVSHNALQKVVYNQWSLTKQYLPSCIVLRMNAWRFQFTIQLRDSSDVINSTGVVSESHYIPHYIVHFVGFTIE